ncbi:tetratricopeptide repeat protein [Methylobacterium sp. NEAU 140]|uniref:tetratricopeptide repeat protein n=1 Tax=Methylobacterium sp. NEAU 140 TaxID=3064945 RepID=UPI002735CAEB|nr:tetratricopeptide repeat protein [Methylobacterium sp. NEAU 140]MDP4026444.1 tetratricopeptide repeat protein [Methylobacterium sp. NEAU 140]
MAVPHAHRLRATSPRRLRSAALAGLLTVLSAAAKAQEIRCDEPPAPDWQVHTASVNVTWGEPQPLVPIPNLYAWEKATLTVSDAANVNREIYEERKCNWFGINCWYEKRVRNNPVTAAQLKFTYSVARSDQPFEPRHPQDSKPVGTVDDDPVVGDDAKDGDKDDGLWRDTGITGSRTPRGVIGLNDSSINRTSCDGEPRVCSVGAYTVKFKIDSGPRAYRLVSELSARPYAYDDLMSPDVLNLNLRQSGPNVRACAAKALYGQATTYHGPGSGSTPAERQKILQEALKLNPTDTSIRTALGNTYLETGQFDDARKATTGVISDIEKKRRVGAADAVDYDNLAASYASLAETSWSETAGNSTGSATEAAGALRLSIERLDERLKRFPLTGAVAARGHLVDNSIRLAQILARLGTAQDMVEAVSVIATARDRLPRRLPGVPLESDATGGVAAFSRPDVPLFSNRAWKLDVSTLAVGDDWVLTPFGTDPSGMTSGTGAAQVAVYRRGGARPDVRALQTMLASGRAMNLAEASDACPLQAAVLTEASGLAAVRDGDGTDRLALLPGLGKTVEGRLGALAVARGGGDRVATLAWREDEDAEGGPGWYLVDYRADLTDRRALGVVKDVKEKVPTLRAAPGGQLYAVGLRSPGDGSTSWRILGATKGAEGRSIRCVVGDKGAVRIDDVAFMGSAVAPEGITVVGLGPECVAHSGNVVLKDAGEKDAGEIVLKAPEGDTGRLEAAKVLAGRTSAFAWVTKPGEPVAITSWEPNSRGSPVSSTYKLHVMRWTFGASEQSPTRSPLYQADVAAWATPGDAPSCAGDVPGSIVPAERFRITGLSIASAPSANGQIVDRPVISAVAAGIYGAIALRANDRTAGPLAAAPDAGAAAAARPGRASQSGRLAVSARCNAGSLRDFQIGEETRVYAIRRSDSAVVRLRRETRDRCEGPSLPMTQAGAGRRVYAAPTGATDDALLQVVDLKSDGEVVGLTLAKLPPDAEHRDEPQPKVDIPVTCNLTAGVRSGTCDAAALVAALNGGADARVTALLRDTTTDPGLAIKEPAPSVTNESVQRATHLIFTGKTEDGVDRVAAVPFPLSKDPTIHAFKIPLGAEPAAVLEDEAGPLLVTHRSGATTLTAFDKSGSERGKVDLEEGFLDPDRSKRLVTRDRIVLVAQGTGGQAARLKVLIVKGGRLAAADCADCTLQSDAAILALHRPLQIGPWLNPEGRLERFLADAQLRRIVVAKLGDDLGWKGWTSLSLDGVGGLDLASAGAGAPILIDGGSALIVPQIGTVEQWMTKP